MTTQFIEPEAYGNLHSTSPHPTSTEIKEFIWNSIPTHQDGDEYELTIKERNGVERRYTFKMNDEHELFLESICFGG